MNCYNNHKVNKGTINHTDKRIIIDGDANGSIIVGDANGSIIVQGSSGENDFDWKSLLSDLDKLQKMLSLVGDGDNRESAKKAVEDLKKEAQGENKNEKGVISVLKKLGKGTLDYLLKMSENLSLVLIPSLISQKILN